MKTETWEQLVKNGEQMVNNTQPQTCSSHNSQLVRLMFTRGKEAATAGTPHLEFQRNWLQLSEYGKQCAKAYHDGVRSIIKTFPEFIDLAK
jgi:hypothetical protein